MLINNVYLVGGWDNDGKFVMFKKLVYPYKHSYSYNQL